MRSAFSWSDCRRRTFLNEITNRAYAKNEVFLEENEVVFHKTTKGNTVNYVVYNIYILNLLVLTQLFVKSIGLTGTMLSSRHKPTSDSDSDKTVDSDELIEFISRKNKMETKNTGKRKLSKPLRRAAEHELSDSDEEVLNNEPNLSRPNQEPKGMTKISSSTDKRPLCKYGRTCYRKSPLHLKQFRHNEDDSSSTSPSPSSSTTDCSSSTKKQKMDISEKGSSNYVPQLEIDAIGLFFTKVSGIPHRFNENIAVGIKDILSPSVGKLKASAQFNYMIDIPWLMEQYPTEFKSCPLLLVHGEQRDSKRALEKSASPFQNITFCQADLPILYGTHHTKMMLLLYETGLRIVVHTSNLISSDWYQKTQGAWVSPVFPILKSSSSDGESPTRFKGDLLDYINSYHREQLNEWCRIINSHDFSSAKVFLIGSVPGRHIETRRTMFGHLKLRKVLKSHGPAQEKLSKSSYIIGQFSSIGSLGTNADQWLCGEWLASLSTVKGSGIQSSRDVPLQLIFPSVENVRKSLEGYPAGANLPYSKNVAIKQPYLNSFFHQWKADITGRSPASPHIKTYLRIGNENRVMWFLVTSANLSKAAWGLLEKYNTQLMIRSYELGVLFLPQFFGDKDAFSLAKTKKPGQYMVLPYDIPLAKYSQKDEPWVWDAPHTYAPDRNGNMWQPT